MVCQVTLAAYASRALPSFPITSELKHSPLHHCKALLVGLDYSNRLCEDGRIAIEAKSVTKRAFPTLAAAAAFFEDRELTSEGAGGSGGGGGGGFFGDSPTAASTARSQRRGLSLAPRPHCLLMAYPHTLAAATFSSTSLA